jgi:hypothetical protein
MAEPDSTKETALVTERRNRVGAVAPEAGYVARAVFARAGFRDPTLVLHWAEIAGADVARLATPIKLTDGPRGATLTLKAEPGAALFLQHETRSLTERINAYLGRAAVLRLRFVQGPLVHRPLPAPRKVVRDVAPDKTALAFKGPDKLRNALINLAIARRRSPSAD